MIEYGKPPVFVDLFSPDVDEMMFYLYLPVVMPGWGTSCRLPNRLRPFGKMVDAASRDYSSLPNSASEPYVYLTVKRMFVSPESPGNRPGWHCDGFGSRGDINYIWSDMNPTEFLIGEGFLVSDDDAQSMIDMAACEGIGHIQVGRDYDLMRLNEGVIHRVGPVQKTGVRTFVKITFSEHVFSKKGNSHNYLFDYDWDMSERQEGRNIDHTSTVRVEAM